MTEPRGSLCLLQQSVLQQEDTQMHTNTYTHIIHPAPLCNHTPTCSHTSWLTHVNSHWNRSLSSLLRNSKLFPSNRSFCDPSVFFYFFWLICDVRDVTLLPDLALRLNFDPWGERRSIVGVLNLEGRAGSKSVQTQPTHSFIKPQTDKTSFSCCSSSFWIRWGVINNDLIFHSVIKICPLTEYSSAALIKSKKSESVFFFKKKKGKSTRTFVIVLLKREISFVMSSAAFFVTYKKSGPDNTRLTLGPQRKLHIHNRKLSFRGATINPLMTERWLISKYSDKQSAGSKPSNMKITFLFLLANTPKKHLCNNCKNNFLRLWALIIIQ